MSPDPSVRLRGATEQPGDPAERRGSASPPEPPTAAPRRKGDAPERPGDASKTEPRDRSRRPGDTPEQPGGTSGRTGRAPGRRAAFLRRASLALLAWTGAVFFALLLVPLLNRHPTEVSQSVMIPALVMAVPALLLRNRTPALVAFLTLTWGILFTSHTTWATGYTKLVVDDVMLAYIALHKPRSTRTIACMGVFLLQLVAAFGLPHGSEGHLQGVAMAVLGLVAALTTARMLRERREHAVELRSRETEQAVTAERLRIARELHDMVAHSIGIVAIQAGVGSRVIDTQPDEARNALKAIEATSRETLAGLRRMLVTLRESGDGARRGQDAPAPLDPAPGLVDLDRLVAATRDAGVRVELRWAGERRPLPPEIDLSAFRIVQEAVTNVVRHARVDACRVTIAFTEDGLIVEIEDDGAGAASGPSADGGGFGIVGMRERAALLRGELAAGPRPGGGFRVAARIPIRSSVPAVTG